MSKLTFIIGGARSGKSAFAMKLAKKHKHVCYVATADIVQTSQNKDDEMIKRIQNHQKNRPANWKTIEAPLELDKAISNLNSKLDVVLIDCITLYITNMLLKSSKKKEEEHIIDTINKLCTVCKKIPPHVIMVSNEVGYGIVPDNALSRRFRDIAGYANQIIAREADNVYLITAGIETKIK
ncbi:MAG: adenosylcobinamide-phosphateguanylyltransferase [Candidatus Scalindua rubra]|uniref:Adenosylcobinamide kinase n=1 Tax=Candidatus Scalindua rubra TaxID=1872076 RepID=A0A1E3X611_9BACT|nr:MAG: adenosylcobinamide-phosphateguanylyltransferase [Candidatus Scalindua rubra]